ncbi:MAG: gluconate 2-dehydrogenase subunit 3 family protein [Deltaproteobacteria bacterium]|nr:gluconate 2-dehydrogenase subunit 3 family protein [Deltaproteobacteria bacterium]MBW2362480.1 gluconate 2-dehydrogenase subunit 3 family protein [Deltaproteobacteria bacterium]
MPLQRREFLSRAAVLAGGVLSAGCTRALQLWQPDATRAPSRRVLDAAQRARLVRAVDLILPETDTPGALDAGVPDFVEMMLVDYYYEPERVMLIAGLEELEARAQARSGVGFVDADELDQIAILSELQKEGLAQLAAAGASAGGFSGFSGAATPPPPAFFQALRELVAVGYCTSSVAAQHHFQFAPVHGDFEGCVPFEDDGRTHVM